MRCLVAPTFRSHLSWSFLSMRSRNGNRFAAVHNMKRCEFRAPVRECIERMRPLGELRSAFLFSSRSDKIHRKVSSADWMLRSACPSPYGWYGDDRIFQPYMASHVEVVRLQVLFCSVGAFGQSFLRELSVVLADLRPFPLAYPHFRLVSRNFSY